MKRHAYVHVSCSYKKREYGAVTFYVTPAVEICRDNIGDREEDLMVSMSWLFWTLALVIC